MVILLTLPMQFLISGTEHDFTITRVNGLHSVCVVVWVAFLEFLPEHLIYVHAL